VDAGILAPAEPQKTTIAERGINRPPYSKNAIIVSVHMAWTVETLNDVVDAELEALPADMRARFVHIALLIQEFGIERVREPHVRHLRGRLWEMRMKGKDGISRAIYVTATNQRVVVVRVFVKKTQKTPSREIELALQRSREVRQ
jgi:phage-related protein